MTNTLLDQIDLIQESAIDAELEVLNSMVNAYSKALTICEHSETAESFMDIIQEADIADTEEVLVEEKKHGKIRQFINKLLALLKRLAEKFMNYLTNKKLEKSFDRYVKLHDPEKRTIIKPFDVSVYRLTDFDKEMREGLETLVGSLREVYAIAEYKDNKNNPDVQKSIYNSHDKILLDKSINSHVSIESLADCFDRRVDKTIDYSDYAKFMNEYIYNQKGHLNLIKEILKIVSKLEKIYNDKSELADFASPKYTMQYRFLCSTINSVSKFMNKMTNDYARLSKGLLEWVQILIDVESKEQRDAASEASKKNKTEG